MGNEYSIITFPGQMPAFPNRMFVYQFPLEGLAPGEFTRGPKPIKSLTKFPFVVSCAPTITQWRIEQTKIWPENTRTSTWAGFPIIYKCPDVPPRAFPSAERAVLECVHLRTAHLQFRYATADHHRSIVCESTRRSWGSIFSLSSNAIPNESFYWCQRNRSLISVFYLHIIIAVLIGGINWWLKQDIIGECTLVIGLFCVWEVAISNLWFYRQIIYFRFVQQVKYFALLYEEVLSEWSSVAISGCNLPWFN